MAKFGDLFRRFQILNATLVWSAMLYWLGSIFFGYDSFLYNGLQGIPSFLQQFGEPKTSATGAITYALPAYRKSLLGSVPFAGKFAGCLVIPFLGNAVGRKRSYIILNIVQILGAVLQMTSKSWTQFLVGRIVAYFAIGLVDVTVPVYQAEIVPSPVRGFFVGSLQLLLGVGALIGSGVTKAYSGSHTKEGWLVPMSIQIIPAAIALAFVAFTPESPRWLLSKGRVDDAKRALNRLRRKQDVADGTTEAELEALQTALQESNESTFASPVKLLSGNNPRRLFIALGVWSAQQLTGNAFIVVYSTSFYLQVGISRDTAYSYNVIQTSCGICCGLIAMYLVDLVGRRPLLITGIFFQTFFMFLLAGLGSHPPFNENTKHMIVACILLKQLSLNISTTALAPIITSEIATPGLRETLMAAGMGANVVCAFAISFSVPYLLGAEHANLGPKVGYIFGGGGVLSLLFAIFCVPELKGRTLEEADELFAANLWAWQFSSYKCKGAGAALEAVEKHAAVPRAAPTESPVEDKGEQKMEEAHSASYRV